MWRFDAGRTAASPDDLPEDLVLQWTRRYSPRTPTWDDLLNNDLMPYDRVFEPIVAEGRVFVGFNDSDKLVCWDVKTGEELWHFFTEGPVRLPPVSWNQYVYCVSDDGHLYCLNASDGSLCWKFRGGPSARKVLGNRRIISMWPARGGPVVREGRIYFAASIWPFMGTFIYALDAETGRVEWVNDSTSASYIQQPHSADSFAGVAPQGAFAATEKYLVVPGGRSVPAVFDRHTGQLVHFHLKEGGKGTGGTLVIANDRDFYVHTRLRGVRKFDLVSGKKTEVLINEPVLDGELVYTSTADSVRAIDENKQVVWELPVDGSGDLIKAGNTLYVAGKSEITAIRLPTETQPAQRSGTIPVEGEVVRLVAGGDSLLAVTRDGRIFAFGAAGASNPRAIADPRAITSQQRPLDTVEDPATKALLAEHGATEGYAFVYGVDDPKLLDRLLSSSDLHLVVVEKDAALVAQLRERYDATGHYGKRIAIHTGDPLTFRAPPYVASVVVVGTTDVSQLARPDMLRAMYESVRPYGGILWFPLAKDREQVTEALSAADLEQVHLVSGEANVVLAKRVGPLPGSAPWTHLYGNAANTVKSDDQLVKLPLGVLWFGGNSNQDVLPRHSHAPCEQVIGGRLFVEGMNSLSARDVYTGRVLWIRQFEDLDTQGIYYDDTYTNKPLDPSYNQVHIPGANARGTNFVATQDSVYLAIGNECHVLAVATGETTQVIPLPKNAEGDAADHWTYLAVYGDILLAGVDYADFAKRFGYTYKPTRRRSGAWSSEWFGSRSLAALDRHSGKLLWRVDARYSFLHNGIVAGNNTVFLLDKLPLSVEKQLSRRGQPEPSDYQILAVDAKTGDILWKKESDIFGTWLGFSQEHNILIQAGADASDRAIDEIGQGIVALRGDDGSEIWQKSSFKYTGPCILHNDMLMTNSSSRRQTNGFFHLLDGSPVLIEDPLTGRQIPWKYTRTYGCNTAVASEHLLTFRSGAAGYYDLSMKCGVGNLGGFRSGCSSNLIAADGVLNAPDFTRTCSCGYQNQTSLALVHMPEVETWTISHFDDVNKTGRLKRVGINFGAPGARRSSNGTLWLEFPSVSERPYPIEIDVTGPNVDYFRRHMSVASGNAPWIASSGIKNVSSVTLKLPTAKATDSAETAAARPYTVCLRFAEPESKPSGQRIFDVLIQGKVVLTDFDIRRESGSPWRDVEKTFSGILLEDRSISIELRSQTPDFPPVLSGLELIAEPDQLPESLSD
ncbi:MAG: PQQ-binding-like beta-propeller repeat protein [Planctomycetes bacterium]|nr:PQQ-binding-like beta-propeller repeat protein [Planctomycetota bacterium]